jgi:hypothetical protein
VVVAVAVVAIVIVIVVARRATLERPKAVRTSAVSSVHLSEV